jgi:hypothetical protein
MAMSRALRCGAPRLLGYHGGVTGRWFQAQYVALERRLGPFDPILRNYAGAIAALWVTFRQDATALQDAERARRQGRGRRPSTQAISRLKKRQGLSWGSYDAALRRLEELAAQRRPQNPVAAVQAAVERLKSR